MRPIRAILAFVAISLLSSCSMITSYPVSGPTTPQLSGGGAGGYSLAKHLLQVSVSGTGKGTTVALATSPIQDTSTFIQTGFNLSPTSNDDITVTYEGGLLRSVTASADDKTGDILVEIGRIAGSFRSDKMAASDYSFEFDPFIARDAADTNARLRAKYGICVEVEIAPGEWSPGCGNWSLGRRTSAGPDVELGFSYPPQKQELSGLYYKRAMAHRVHTVRNGSTLEIKHYMFANAAPIFRVDVERTLFVKRETTLLFAAGELTSVQVKKPSEGLELAQLPLKVANAFLEAPVLAVSDHKSVQKSEANLNNARAAALTVDAGLAQRSGVRSSDLRTTPLDGFRSTDLSEKTLSDCRNIQLNDPVLCLDFLKRASGQK